MNKEQLLAMGLSDEQANNVMESLKGSYVTKSRFDEVNEAKKQLERDITDLGLEANAQKESEKAEFEAQIKNLKVDSAVYKALVDSKAKNTVATRALLADFLKGAQIDGEKVMGLDEEISKLRESCETSFLFESPVSFKGIKPGEKQSGAEIAQTSLADAVKNYFER